MIPGAHVKTTGGIENCFQNAEKIGAECIQIFGASPRQWNAPLPDPKKLNAYHQEQKRTNISPVFLHASYLVNLATPDKELYEKSVNSLIKHLKIALLLKADGLIYHIGSYKNTTKEKARIQVAKAMETVIVEVLKYQKSLESSAPRFPYLIMENSAGGGNKLGLTPEGIGQIYNQVQNPDIKKHIKICIDTAHAFSAGILQHFTKKELDDFTKKCDQSFSLKNLIVLHVNDSMTPFDSKKDRHQNIGKGEIGLKAFKNLSKHHFFGSLPWILEVPGFDHNGPDKKNIQTLKSL